MRTQSRDTSVDIERVLIRGFLQFSPMTRFSRVRSLTYTLAEANRHQSPAASEWDSAVAFVRNHYGDPFATALSVYHPLPETIAFDLLATLERIVQVLDAGHVRFAVTGSLACGVYGFPRTCRDIDLLVLPEDVPQVGEVSPWFIDVCDDPHAPTMASWLDPQTLIKVDLVAPPPPFQAEHLLARARLLPLTEQGFQMPVLSAEDVLLTRLFWYQVTGSRADDQWNDLMGVVKIQAPTLDASYLWSQMQQLHLADLYTQLCVDTEFEGIPDGTTDEHAGRPAIGAAGH